MNKCRVLVVDNDPFTLTSLVNALENNQLVVAGRASTAREALVAQREGEVDVALLDLDLGIGPNGIDLAHALRARSPDIGLVLLSTYRDPRLLAPGMLKPPRGMAYLSKGDVDDFGRVAALVRAAAMAPLHIRVNRESRPANLTESQREVLKMVAEGHSTGAIAASRGVGPKAIEQAISRLAEILGVRRGGSTNQRVLLTRAYLELTGKITGEGDE